MTKTTDPLLVQDFYKTELSIDVPASWDITLTVLSAPLNSKGFIIVDPESESNRERMYYHDVVGNTILVKWVNRIDPKEHFALDKVQINDTSLIFNYLSKLQSTTLYIEQLDVLDINVWWGPILKGIDTVSVSDTLLTVTDSSINYIYYKASTNEIKSALAEGTVATDKGIIIADITAAWGAITSVEYRQHKLFVWNSIDTVTLSWSEWLVDTYTILFTDETETYFNVTNWSNIDSISYTSSDLNVDTYTVTLTNWVTTTFDVTNGTSISQIDKTSTLGLVDTYTVTLSDNSTTNFDVTNWNWITTILKTWTVWNIDTYTITFDNGATTTFIVTNWEWLVNSVVPWTWVVVDSSDPANPIVSTEIDSASLNYMLWVTGTVWKAYSLNPYQQLSVGTPNDFWSVAQPMLSQSFYAQNVDITELKLMIQKISSPVDNIFIEIQEDTAWLPNWTVVTNWTSANIWFASLSASFTEETFTFASVPMLTSETLYHIVVQRTGSTDAVNYYQAESAWSSVQIGNMSIYSWSWAIAADDLYFKMEVWYSLVTLSDNITNNVFVWVLQTAWVIWEIRRFNRDYDDNQTWLVVWGYYGLWTSWNFSLWGNFRAISTTEINLDIINKTNNSIKELFTFWETLVHWDSVYQDVSTGKVLYADPSDTSKLEVIWTIASWWVLDDIWEVYVGGIADWYIWLTYWEDIFLSEKYLDSDEVEQATWSLVGQFSYVWRLDISKQGQEILTTSETILKSITVDLRKQWSPTGNIQCKAFLIDKTTLLWTAINTFWSWDTTTSYASYKFVFDNITVPANTVIFLEFSVTSWNNNSNFYQIAYDTWSPYSDWLYWRFIWFWISVTTEDAKFRMTLWVFHWKNYNNIISPVKLGVAIAATKILMAPIDSQRKLLWNASSTATTWSIVLWNAVDYLTMNINWIDRKIPYYDV